MKNKLKKIIISILTLSIMSGCGVEDKDPELIIDSNCPTSVECGKEIQLLATMENTKEKGIVWSVDDELIATITEDGKLSALRKGYVLAKATSVADPDLYQEVPIEVKKNTLIVVEITNKFASMKVGETKKFSASITGDTTNSGIGWQVNNEALASVDSNGNVTVHQIGLERKIVVTAFSKINPDAFAECEVTLSPKDNGEETDNSIEEVNGYKLIFKDDFSSERLNKNNWEVMIGDGSAYGVSRWGNEEEQYYAEDNLKVVEGNLIISAKNEEYHSENLRNLRYTSGRIRSKGKVAHTYGRIEAKISCPTGNGIWPAFWMLPEFNDKNEYGGWPNSGEIDIMEVRGRQKYQMFGTLHFSGTDGEHLYKNASMFFDNGTIVDFHTYAVEWDESEIRFFTDGKLYGTIKATEWSVRDGTSKFSNAAPFDKNFHILINMAIGGNFDGYRMPDAEDIPARMKVDYVKWYQK